MTDEKQGLTRRDMMKYMGVVGAAASASAPLPIILRYISPSPDWPPEKGEIPKGEINLGALDKLAPLTVFSFNFGKVALPGIVVRLDSPPQHQTIGSTEASGKDISGGEGYSGVPSNIIAYTLKCPHLGCITGTEFESPNVIVCPCHFSKFDLSKGAAVIAGPSPSPLPEIALELRNGELIATGWRDENFVKSLAAFKAVI